MIALYPDRFTPIPKADNGYQTAALGGSMLLSDLFAVPVDANSGWLQASAAIAFRLDGDTTAGVGFVLPTGVVLPLNGVHMLRGLVLIGSASVSAQFGMGPVGPIPPTP